MTVENRVLLAMCGLITVNQLGFGSVIPVLGLYPLDELEDGHACLGVGPEPRRSSSSHSSVAISHIALSWSRIRSTGAPGDAAAVPKSIGAAIPDGVMDDTVGSALPERHSRASGRDGCAGWPSGSPPAEFIQHDGEIKELAQAGCVIIG